MANITSVRALARSPSYAGPVICGILWAVFLLARVWVFGVLLFGATIVWATNLKSQYTVLVGTAGGEHAALISPDIKYVRRIVQAINDAIIARG